MKTCIPFKAVLVGGALLLGGFLSGCTAYVDEPVARTTTYRTETTSVPAPVETARVTTTRTY